MKTSILGTFYYWLCFTVITMVLLFSFCTNYERDNPYDSNGISWSPPSKPAAPSISNSNAGDGSVTVSWGTVSDATSYNLYYRAGSTVDKSNGTVVTGVTSPRTVSGLINGSQYAFAVSAVNSVGEGNLSSVSTATPSVSPTVPGVPSITSATPGDSSVTVSWGAVSGATSYNLYYRIGSTVDKSNGTKVTGVTSPRTITGLASGYQYAFAVSAVNSAGEGPSSISKTAAPQATGNGLWVVTGNSLTDPDGNTYTTVTIGNQVWTVENLCTTKYNDGISIPHITSSTSWLNLTTPGFCFYNNSSSTSDNAKWGALYNWYAVNTGKLTPSGWHVPTDADWSKLTNYLIANGYNWDGSTSGDKTAKSMASKTDWNTSSTPGTIGCDFSKNNSSGFSALPGGYRSGIDECSFIDQGGRCIWWSSTSYSTSTAYVRSLFSSFSWIGPTKEDMRYGFSVRLVKNSD